MLQVDIPRQLLNLPAFEPVALKLVTLMQRSDAGFAEVADLVRLDAGLAAEVLHLANSALIGPRRQVVSVAQALAFIGMDRMKNLVMTVAMKNYFGAKVGEDSVLGRVWRHNLAGAIVSEHLARAGGVDRDRAYTAGLLHELGRLALMKAFPRQYQDLLQRWSGTDAEVLVAEHEALGFDYVQAGNWVAQAWGFPDELRNAIAAPHGAATRRSALAVLVHAACQAVGMLGFHAFGQPREWNAAILGNVVPARIREELEENREALRDLVRERIEAIA